MNKGTLDISEESENRALSKANLNDALRTAEVRNVFLLTPQDVSKFTQLDQPYSEYTDNSNDSVESLYQVVNNQDVQVNVKFFGTHLQDTDNNESELLKSINVAANSSKSETASDAWDLIHVEVKANRTPTPNGEVTVRQMAKQVG